MSAQPGAGQQLTAEDAEMDRLADKITGALNGPSRTQ